MTAHDYSGLPAGPATAPSRQPSFGETCTRIFGYTFAAAFGVGVALFMLYVAMVVFAIFALKTGAGTGPAD